MSFRGAYGWYNGCAAKTEAMAVEDWIWLGPALVGIAVGAIVAVLASFLDERARRREDRAHEAAVDVGDRAEAHHQTGVWDVAEAEGLGSPRWR